MLVNQDDVRLVIFDLLLGEGHKTGNDHDIAFFCQMGGGSIDTNGR